MVAPGTISLPEAVDLAAEEEGDSEDSEEAVLVVAERAEAGRLTFSI
jgi:hypothetical protein